MWRGLQRAFGPLSGRDLPQDGRGVPRLTFEEQALHGVTLPAIRTVERCHKRRGVELREIWDRAWPGASGKTR